MDDPICQKLKKELEGKPKVRTDIIVGVSVQCLLMSGFECGDGGRDLPLLLP